MAVTNFIQSIWSKKIQDDLELKCKLVDNCLRDYEGDVKQAQSVKILGVGEPTIGTYNPGQDIVIEEMSDRGQMLTIDQLNYFAFYVDDVDKASRALPAMLPPLPICPEKQSSRLLTMLSLLCVSVTLTRTALSRLPLPSTTASRMS